MKRRQLRFGRGFRVVISNRRAQAAQMVLPRGSSEGDSDIGIAARINGCTWSVAGASPA